MIDAIKALPKDFIIVNILKIVLGLLALITLGVTLVAGTIIYLYLNHHPFWEIVFGGGAAWLVFLLIIGAVLYHKQTQYRSKIDLIISLFNKQAVVSMAIHTLNSLLHKKHPEEPTDSHHKR